jgi:hypothetical protein
MAPGVATLRRRLPTMTERVAPTYNDLSLILVQLEQFRCLGHPLKNE